MKSNKNTDKTAETTNATTEPIDEVLARYFLESQPALVKSARSIQSAVQATVEQTHAKFVAGVEQDVPAAVEQAINRAIAPHFKKLKDERREKGEAIQAEAQELVETGAKLLMQEINNSVIEYHDAHDRAYKFLRLGDPDKYAELLARAPQNSHEFTVVEGIPAPVRTRVETVFGVPHFTQQLKTPPAIELNTNTIEQAAQTTVSKLLNPVQPTTVYSNPLFDEARFPEEQAGVGAPPKTSVGEPPRHGSSWTGAASLSMGLPLAPPRVNPFTGLLLVGMMCWASIRVGIAHTHKKK